MMTINVGEGFIFINPRNKDVNVVDVILWVKPFKVGEYTQMERSITLPRSLFNGVCEIEESNHFTYVELKDNDGNSTYKLFKEMNKFYRFLYKIKYSIFWRSL